MVDVGTQYEEINPGEIQAPATSTPCKGSSTQFDICEVTPVKRIVDITTVDCSPDKTQASESDYKPSDLSIQEAQEEPIL